MPESIPEKLKKMGEKISKTHQDPVLRKHLDDQKRLSTDELMSMLSSTKSKWTLASSLSNYTRKSDRNLKGICPQGHEVMVSIADILNDIRCKVCHPKRTGKLNPAFKSIDSFLPKFIEKFGCDAFLFNPDEYQGMYKQIEFQCTKCNLFFMKAPRVILWEKIGCPDCAKRSSKENQSRTKEKFFELAEQVHPDKFIFSPTENQQYTNTSKILRKCKTCDTEYEQSIASLLGGNGCRVCSKRVKYTTETFIAASKKIWGEKFDYSLVEYINNKHPVVLKCDQGHVFACAPSNHFNGKGCPDCSIKKFVSIGETEWLNSLNIPLECRNRWINVAGQKFNVDALINSTIYEYYGDFWHGNLKRYAPDFFNVHSGMTMQEHYDHTKAREQILRENGYAVITMWESDWKKLRETRIKK